MANTQTAAVTSYSRVSTLEGRVTHLLLTHLIDRSANLAVALIRQTCRAPASIGSHPSAFSHSDGPARTNRRLTCDRTMITVKGLQRQLARGCPRAPARESARAESDLAKLNSSERLRHEGDSSE